MIYKIQFYSTKMSVNTSIAGNANAEQDNPVDDSTTTPVVKGEVA